MRIKVIKRRDREQSEADNAAADRVHPVEVVERWVKDTRRQSEADRRRNIRAFFPSGVRTES